MSESLCEENIFKDVFTKEASHLRNFMYYKCGDLERAEDLMQDAFAKLWEQCSKVSIQKAKAYIFTVANNLFLNEQQHKKVQLKFENSQHRGNDHQDPQYLMEEAEFKKRLLGAIDQLPEGQREVFLMNRIDDLKYREIAERLEISVKAVEKRMHKALVFLRTISDRV